MMKRWIIKKKGIQFIMDFSILIFYYLLYCNVKVSSIISTSETR